MFSFGQGMIMNNFFKKLSLMVIILFFVLYFPIILAGFRGKRFYGKHEFEKIKNSYYDDFLGKNVMTDFDSMAPIDISDNFDMQQGIVSDDFIIAENGDDLIGYKEDSSFDNDESISDVVVEGEDNNNGREAEIVAADTNIDDFNVINEDDIAFNNGGSDGDIVYPEADTVVLSDNDGDNVVDEILTSEDEKNFDDQLVKDMGKEESLLREWKNLQQNEVVELSFNENDEYDYSDFFDDEDEDHAMEVSVVEVDDNTGKRNKSEVDLLEVEVVED